MTVGDIKPLLIANQLAFTACFAAKTAIEYRSNDRQGMSIKGLLVIANIVFSGICVARLYPNEIREIIGRVQRSFNSISNVAQRAFDQLNRT